MRNDAAKERKKEKGEEENPRRDPTIFGHKVLLILCFFNPTSCPLLKPMMGKKRMIFAVREVWST